MKNPEITLPSRIQRLLKWQTVSLAILSIASIAGGIYLSINSYGYTWITIPIAMFVSYCLLKASGFLSTFILKRIFYGSDTETFLNDARDEFTEYDNRIKKNIKTLEQQNEVAPTEQISIKITSTSEVYGRYLDKDFFEWIEVANLEGESVRLFFVGTMDISKGITRPVPDGCMLLEPGVLYGTQAALIDNPA
jgi:hypothetical protein